MRYTSLILLSTSSFAWARVAPQEPAITPAPSVQEFELRQRQQTEKMDLASLAQVLLTGVPPSILDLALTNVPAVSRLLWSEFLDGHTPSWFAALPTEVQAYLSGEFGPTSSNSASSTPATSTSAPTVSQTTSNNQANTSNHHNGGLPLWAKILIGVLVPLLALGLLALLLLCCLRRRRRHRAQLREPRAPTPAFISSSHPAPPAEAPAENVPLRGGYYSSMDNTQYASHSSHNTSSDSGDFQTPIGGPSYEELPPAVAMQQSRRGSRPSLSSLHSVPEVPEPHNAGTMPVPPPRSPRRSRDLSQDPNPINYRRISPLNPAYGHGDGNAVERPGPVDPYNVGQGIYAGGHNPYPSYENPFSDPSPPRQTHMASGGYRGAAHRDNELFMPRQDYENNWPLTALHEAGYDTYRRSRRGSWERGDDRERIYEM